MLAKRQISKQTRQTTSHVERRSSLSMIAGVEFASNSRIVGGRADLYTGGVHEAEALYITRESLFRRDRAAAPESSRESGARRPSVQPRSKSPGHAIFLRSPSASRDHSHPRYALRTFVLHVRHRAFPPSSLTRRRCRPCRLAVFALM